MLDDEVMVEWLEIWKLFEFIASENCAVMLAFSATFVAPLAGTVLNGSTVGAGRAARAVPAAKSSVRAIVVNSSSVFLIIFLSPP